MLSTFFYKDSCRFTVWAPEKNQMTLHIVDPFDKEFQMQKNERGYFSVEVQTKDKGLRYFFKPDGKKDFPDPASQFQPDGVHGPSQTIDHPAYEWDDSGWKGLPINEMIIYELHVGLFTPEGTFESIISRLNDLKNVGINTIELMPIAQFPGNRNWGYDGVFPYAVQNSYGGPTGLKKLVDACHQKGIAVLLDVVYNHLGPEGNYFSQFGPYFTNKYHTPWGEAINLDGEWSDGVREFFSDNVLYWFKYYHIDGLRCDAIHALFDNGAVHFWELTHQKRRQLENELDKSLYLIAESDLNSPKVVKSPEQGGYGFDAQWLDDFHHALYVLTHPDDKERYYDFGTIEQMVKAYNEGFIHSGEWVQFRKRKHGASSANIPGSRFVVFNQNHDQIGNRADGKRLNALVNLDRVKLASAATLLAPYIPMLFMGEEYGDEAPFFYFVDHSEEDLIRTVQEGRNKEFESFGFDDSVPDPQNENTFKQCKLRWEDRNKGHHKIILDWYKELIRLRNSLSPFKDLQKRNLQAKVIGEKAFVLFRHSPGGKETVICLFNFSDNDIVYELTAQGGFAKNLDSKESQWKYDKIITDKTHPNKIIEKDPIQLLPLSVVVYCLQQDNHPEF
jgi:maltooligosyltrehalose trehalohydrolase